MSGERTFTLEIVSGRAGPCVCLDDFRICGPKPWGGGTVTQKWSVRESDLRRAMKAQEATDPSERLRTALEAVLLCPAIIDSRGDPETNDAVSIARKALTDTGGAE